MGGQVHGLCGALLRRHIQPPSASTFAASKVRSLGRVGCLQGATVRVVHNRHVPHLLGTIFRLLLRKIPQNPTPIIP